MPNPNESPALASRSAAGARGAAALRITFTALLVAAVSACSGAFTFEPERNGPGDDDDDGVTVPDTEAWIEAAGSYYGKCWGACLWELDFTDSDEPVARLVVSNWDGEIYGENTGALTQLGVDILVDIARDLAGRELQETYGCPDCADQGGYYFELSVFGDLRRVDYDTWEAPAFLSDIADLTEELTAALGTCESTEWVTIQPECEILFDW